MEMPIDGEFIGKQPTNVPSDLVYPIEPEGGLRSLSKTIILEYNPEWLMLIIEDQRSRIQTLTSKVQQLSEDIEAIHMNLRISEKINKE